MPCHRCGIADAPLANVYHGYALGNDYCWCCQMILYNRRFEKEPIFDAATEARLVKMQSESHAADAIRREQRAAEQRMKLRRAGLNIPPGAMTPAAHAIPPEES